MAETLDKRCRQGLITVRTVLEDHTKTGKTGAGFGVHYHICYTTLRTISPQYVIASAGEGNNYGHPHEEVLERIADVGAAVLRTDELGTIEVMTAGEQKWWDAHQ